MAFVTTTAVAPAPEQAAANNQLSGQADAALLLMGALAGASMTKSARKQYRALRRELAWKALGMQFKSLFSKKQKQDTIAGMQSWLFILLVVAAAALGLWLFGLLGFLILLGLGAIIYLLVRDKN